MERKRKKRRIKFDVKYRGQIESGEFKVVTRSGLPARVICWDREWRNSSYEMPIVALIEAEDGREWPYTFSMDGKFKGSKESDYDLFLEKSSEEKGGNVKATFCINEKEGLASLTFYRGEDTISWVDLSDKEGQMMLDAWSGMSFLCSRSIEDRHETDR